MKKDIFKHWKLSQVVYTKCKFKAMWSCITHLQHLVHQQKWTSTPCDKAISFHQHWILSSHTHSPIITCSFTIVHDMEYVSDIWISSRIQISLSRDESIMRESRETLKINIKSLHYSREKWKGIKLSKSLQEYVINWRNLFQVTLSVSWMNNLEVQLT